MVNFLFIHPLKYFEGLTTFGKIQNNLKQASYILIQLAVERVLPFSYLTPIRPCCSAQGHGHSPQGILLLAACS